VERLLEDAAAGFNLPFMALRYFNAAGADFDTEIGEAHNPETHLIPLALEAVSSSSAPLSIFGRDYPTPDGTAIRDYIHVSDLAHAHVLSLQYLLEGGTPKFLNLGTGSGYSVREILDSVRRVTGTEVPTVDADRRPGDPPKLIADPSLAEKVLSFRAKHSENIDTIIETAWAWMNSEQGRNTLRH
jgi:UDP-glucose 4-epimerase